MDIRKSVKFFLNLFCSTPIIGDFIYIKLHVYRSMPLKAFTQYLACKMGFSPVYWYRDRTCLISGTKKIYVGKNSFVGRPCSYLQGAGGIYIGNYVQLGPNVGVISANHDIYDQRVSVKKPIRIGDYSWIGMGSIVLPGVELGPRTIVGANSVVTKSFPEGYCVIAGNPAKLIKKLNEDEFVKYKTNREFYGFIPDKRFEKQRKKWLDI